MNNYKYIYTTLSSISFLGLNTHILLDTVFHFHKIHQQTEFVDFVDFCVFSLF